MVAARELPSGVLSKDESLSDDVIRRLNAMSDLRHASILQMFGVVSPASAPTLVRILLYIVVVGQYHQYQYQYFFSASIFVVRRNQRRDERTSVICPCDGASEMS